MPTGRDTHFVRLCDEVLFPFLEEEIAKARKAEAGDEPTPFGDAVMEVCRRRGLEVEGLDLSPEHSDALRDHCDGVEGAERLPHLPAGCV